MRTTLVSVVIGGLAGCQAPGIVDQPSTVPPTVQTGAAFEQSLAVFEASVEATLDEGRFPGFAFAVVDQNGVRWAKGYGLANLATGAMVTPDTIFTMGSVSKTFIGTAAAIAWDEGALDLDADINDYLDFEVRNPNAEGTQISFADLASHTAGLIDAEVVYASTYAFGSQRHPESLRDFLASYYVPDGRRYDVERNFADAAPGERYAYSNIGSALAALVIGGATGRSFEDYTRDEIFAPLGMTSTSWFLDEIDRARFAQPYKRGDVDFEPYGDYALATWPDGGLRTSANDLASYLSAIMARGRSGEKDWLSPRAYDRLTAAIDLNDTEGLPRSHVQHGLFWSGATGPSLANRRFFYGHNGSDPGVGAMMYFDPVAGRGAIAMTNADIDEREDIIAFFSLFYQLFEVELPPS